MKKVLLPFLLCTVYMQASLLTVTTQLKGMTCVYIDGINELCIDQKTPKQLEIDPLKEHSALAVNKRGTKSSNFYTLKPLPKDTQEVTLTITEDKRELIITSPTPDVTLEKG